ncbi:hemicentin-2-like [Schistocerca piceifrons]|uniref:hemicentin-2-like n=1 Tax=Schistocerca piceifrons TaxID=274613 RepID=UPI001F5E5FB9|nr:hemicentin-2-like [Schistocerca piceifrons]
MRCEPGGQKAAQQQQQQQLQTPLYQHGLYTGPYFDTSTATNVSAQLGTHAYLPCRVKQLGNKSVSWVRRRDSHILTVDRYTFIADDRFQAFLVDSTSTWTLQVKYVQPRDAGHYECQVSAAEQKLSRTVTLNVVVPQVEIAGGPDLYVRAGSTVSLRCEVRQAPDAPAYVLWFHDGERVLDYADMRVERAAPDTTVAQLSVRDAAQRHSGNYTCRPSNMQPATVFLHVLDGEHPAAMQGDKNGALWNHTAGLWSPLLAALGLAALWIPTAL